MSTPESSREAHTRRELLTIDKRLTMAFVLPAVVVYGAAFGPLHAVLGVQASVLGVLVAGVGGGLLGRRAGLWCAVLLGVVSAALYGLVGASGEVLLGAGGGAAIAMLVGWGTGTLHDWARRAQSLADAEAYTRETLETEVAELIRAEHSMRARGDQHAVVATLSQRALVAPDLPGLFEEVVRRVGDALRADSCTLWKCGADGELSLVASYAALFGQKAADGDLERHARYTHWVGEAVVVNDLRTDPRLRGGPPDAWLSSGVMVPVRSQGVPYAILGVHTRTERAFASYDVSFLEVVSNLVSSAVTRKHIEEGLERQALHDSLTGLANRTLFQDRLDQALHVARRENKPMALMLMDLDRFKEVNDTLGHQAGDQLLLEVSRRLQQAKRAADTVARLGGDEFALILPSVGDTEAAVRLGTKLLEVIERPMPLDGQIVDIGASIGVAIYPEHGEGAQELLRRADVAMYVAKHNGSGVALYSSEHDQHSRGRLALASAFRQALDSAELVVHYQPLIDLRNSGVGGMEALLRWQHPQLGLLGPDTFIPLAEQMGLSASLDRWALDATLRQAATWQAAGFEIPVSVNLSMRSVLDPNLTRTVADLLSTWGVPATRLELEITESSIMADPVKVRAVLAQCQALGVRIAIDDFGTGYSSLAYLKRLPVDSLKIDTSFVSDMAADKADLAIVRSTLDLGHNLGLKVTAEGVEDEITCRLLSQLRCDLAQGHYFSPPLPAAEVLSWLRQSPWAPQSLTARAA